MTDPSLAPRQLIMLPRVIAWVCDGLVIAWVCDGLVLRQVNTWLILLKVMSCVSEWHVTALLMRDEQWTLLNSSSSSSITWHVLGAQP